MTATRLEPSLSKCLSVRLQINVLLEYNEIKEETKNPETAVNILYKNDGNILCQL